MALKHSSGTSISEMFTSKNRLPNNTRLEAVQLSLVTKDKEKKEKRRAACIALGTSF